MSAPRTRRYAKNKGVLCACGQPAYCKELCIVHYRDLRRGGPPRRRSPVTANGVIDWDAYPSVACSNCGRHTQQPRGGRCRNCWSYQARTGRERPPEGCQRGLSNGLEYHDDNPLRPSRGKGRPHGERAPSQACANAICQLVTRRIYRDGRCHSCHRWVTLHGTERPAGDPSHQRRASREGLSCRNPACHDPGPVGIYGRCRKCQSYFSDNKREREPNKPRVKAPPRPCENPACGVLLAQRWHKRCQACAKHWMAKGVDRSPERVAKGRAMSKGLCQPRQRGVLAEPRPCGNPACNKVERYLSLGLCQGCRRYQRDHGILKPAEVFRSCSPRACANPACAAPGVDLYRGRCRSCDRHLDRYGVERPAERVAAARARRSRGTPRAATEG